MADPHDPNSSHEHDASHGVGHLVPAKYLIATCVALLVLTLITVAAAKVDFAAYGFPDLNIVVAMAIAVVKASLVCMFFMHLFWDRPINAFILVASIAFVGIFIGFAMTDTFEYRGTQELFQRTELQGGDSKDVQTKLLELQPP